MKMCECINVNCRSHVSKDDCSLFYNIGECESHSIVEPISSPYHKDNQDGYETFMKELRNSDIS